MQQLRTCPLYFLKAKFEPFHIFDACFTSLKLWQYILAAAVLLLNFNRSNFAI